MLCSLIASFSYVIAPVADMREQPADASEIVSQVYFSESVHILEDQGQWVKIENEVDGYIGWVGKKALCSRKDSFLSGTGKTIAKVNSLRAHLYDVQDTVYGPTLTLPFESQLCVLDPLDSSSKTRWIKVSLPDGQDGYIQRADVLMNPTTISVTEMCLLSRRFLDLRYYWGGRSSFGYDCSGFVQMLYRQMGVFLPRDSRDQIKSPLLRETSLDKLQPGDLIFFGLDESKICHVGMYLGDDHFIHSSPTENAPYIHISTLSAPQWSGSGRCSYRALRTLAH